MKNSNSKYTIADMNQLAATRSGSCLSEIYLGMHGTLDWQCEKGHTWSATPHSIKNSASWCPYCSGRKCTRDESFGELHPDLVKEVHPSKNENLKIFEISPKSNMKIWWRCNKDEAHEWQTKIGHRVEGSGCPFCAGQKATKDNNLEVKYPGIASEWDQKRNGDLKPQDTLPSSGKKVWWLCPENDQHGYQAKIYHRTGKQKSGCPYCRGLKVNHTNNLRSLFPDIARQWHFEKNGKLTPQDVSPGSDRKVWWQCDRSIEHVWEATIGERTRGTGCPKCSPQTSLNEIRIFAEISALFDNVEQRFKSKGFEADIFLPDLNLAIEYDGAYWHSPLEKQVSDGKKNEAFSKQGIHLIRVREEPLKKISANDIIVPSKALTKEPINEIIKAIIKLYQLNTHNLKSYLKTETFYANDRYNEIVSWLPGPPPEKSLAALYPQIAAEFHPHKNAPLSPIHFYPGGGQKIWWLCSADSSHEWQTTPASRTSGSHGCPMCSGMKASPSNNLEVLHPKLMLEWHWDKNKKFDPKTIKPGSSYKVWWKCTANEAHEWQAPIANRVKGKQKCPTCNPFFVSETNNLSALFPSIALEWHPTKNKSLTPQEISAVSSVKVWWKCTLNSDHDWKASVGSRTKLETGCPICSGRLCERSDSLQKFFPDLADEWHPTKNKDLLPHRVKPSSARNVWWLCSANGKHEWKEVISSRVSGSKCPHCTNQ